MTSPSGAGVRPARARRLVGALALAALLVALALGCQAAGLPPVATLTAVAAASAVGGAVLASIAAAMPLGTLATAHALGWAALAAVAQGHGALADITAPAARLLLLAPAPSFLCGALGASLVLLAGRRALDPSALGRGAEKPRRAGFWHAPVELRLARRLLLSRSSGVLSLVTGISVVGVALGVALVIVAMGILGGFEHDLVRKIVGANAHLAIDRIDGGPLPAAQALATTMDAVAGVRAAAPIVEAEVAVAGTHNYAAGTVFGIDVQRAPRVLHVLDTLVAGRLADLDEPCAPLCPAVLGLELARSLGVAVGDRVRLISPVHEVLTPLGPAPKSQGLVVVGIFASHMYDYDSRYLFMDRAAAARFVQLPMGAATSVLMAVDAPDAMADVQAEALAAARTATAAAGEAAPLQALSWTARNQTLFAALALERVVAAVVLAFIVLVASFAVVNTLSMSILERQGDIAILKTMGAPQALILRTFVAQGLLIGGLGLAGGVALGTGVLTALASVRLGLPFEVYYLESLPVHIDAADILAVAVGAALIVWLFSIFPSHRGATLSPVEGLRDG